MRLRPETIPWKVVVALLLAVLTIGVFGQVGGFDFIRLDDDLYVTQNRHVQSGFTAQSLAWALTNLDAGFWHPLTWLSLMLDFQWYGLNPSGFHWTNLILHVASTLLLFLVLQRMTGALWKSAFVAALFALHPLHVESVAWVAERKDVLSTFFWMLSLWAYVSYVGRPGLIRYGVVLSAFVLGLMSKTMVVTLPFVFLLLDWWPLDRFRSERHDRPGPSAADGSSGVPTPARDVAVRLVMEKIPFIVLSIGSVIVTYIAEQRIGAIKAAETTSLAVRGANVLMSYATYLVKMVWPAQLAVYYPHPGSWPLWQVAGAALLLLGVSFLVWRRARRYPYLVVGWLWYLGTLVPVAGFIKIGAHSMADRYTYVPLIGLFIMVAWGFSDLFARWSWRREALTASAVAILCLLSITTWVQLRHWQNSLTLFQHTLAVTENNYVILNNMGAALAEKGEAEQALACYRKALAIKPDDVDARYNMGNILVRLDRPREAVAQYADVLRLKPGLATAHNNMGLALLLLGKTEDAIAHFNEALRIDPSFDQARYNLNRITAGRTQRGVGDVVMPDPSKEDRNTAEGKMRAGLSLVAKGRMDEAMAYFQEALKLDPKLAAAHVNLGLAYAYTQRLDQAVVHFRKALKINPGMFEAHNSLGVALARQGKLKEAVPEFKEALRINPRFAKAHNSLGVVLAQLGQLDEAVSHLREAVRINPDYGEARRNLDAVLSIQSDQKQR